MSDVEGFSRRTKGLSEVAFHEAYGSEEPCRSALFEGRWGRGWPCPSCGHGGHCSLKKRGRLQCKRCKHQVSVTAGTIFHSTKLPLEVWFLSICHVSQSKGGISSAELGRRLGVREATAWPMRLCPWTWCTRQPDRSPLVAFHVAEVGLRSGGHRGSSLG